ncbi:MAG: hypothetical protein ACOX2K_05235 [Bacillota bacterium]
MYQAILRLVDWLAEIPAMSFSTGQPPVPLVMLAVVLLFLLWRLQSPRQRAWLFTGWLTVILLALSWQPLSRFVLNRYQLSVLSVGQGVSTVLHLPGGKALLFDVGGAGDRVGENIIVPYLRHQGTLSVGGIFLSHSIDRSRPCLWPPGGAGSLFGRTDLRIPSGRETGLVRRAGRPCWAETS